MTQFSDLGLAEGLLKALRAEGYDAPTPIQQQAIPHLIAGRDLVGLAQTGTGKTAAFALPILHRLSQQRRSAGARGVRTLVLAPTRELAAQICDSFRAYGRFVGIGAQVVFGGVPIGGQIRNLERGVDVLVATPGRLLDLIERRAVRLDGIEALVLDEADHMMDLGFIHALNRIVKLLPAERQTLFFSATMPPPIAELAKAYVNEPVRVEVTPVSSTVDRITQRVVHVGREHKTELLIDLLQDASIKRALVFSRTKHGANRMVKQLHAACIDAEAIHGDKSQGQRQRALEGFRKGKLRLLVATDIAARGIDIDDVTHVFNYDLPDVPEAYVHRIGRTARAGAEGVAIAFCSADERINLRDIERLTKQAIPVMEHALSVPAPAPQEHRKPHQASKPQRRGKPHGAPQGKPQQHRKGGEQQRGYQSGNAHRAPRADRSR